MKAVCPNLRILYISTRERAYTDDPTALNPEPYAYETGFGVKWTIADQINGTGNLNFDATKRPVVAPYITWGPYFWADGLSPRSDGLVWDCLDTEDDFIHPTASGSGKMASQLLAFFKTDPSARSWFLRSGSAPITTTATTTPTTDAAGTYFQFAATASDTSANVTSYQWTFDDGTFSDLQNPLKVFKVPRTYTVHLAVTDSLGNYSTTNIPVTVGGSPLLGSLLNVSTRGQVSGSNTVLIGGFIVHGTQPKKVLLRAIGPSLFNDGIGNALGDPMLELYDSTGAVIATNDNWQTTQIGGLITGMKSPRSKPPASLPPIRSNQLSSSP